MKNVRKQDLENVKKINTKNILNKKFLDLIKKINFIVHNILITPKINIETTNLDLAMEKMLAKIFWLSPEKIAKLEKDYKEPITLTETMTQAEDYWKKSAVPA